jgi:hypothetical protein
MGVRTPKTYLVRTAMGPAIISQMISPWNACKASLDFAGKSLSPLPTSYVGLPDLELASAFLGDIDVVGWLFDNIGLQEASMPDGETRTFITKHDAGSAIVENSQYLHFKKYFEEDAHFPEGTMTLSDDVSLKGTYLKIFSVPSVAKYDQHYADIFNNITVEMRRNALIKLFSITPEILAEMVQAIGLRIRCSPDKQSEIMTFLSGRLDVFRARFSHHVSTVNAAFDPAERICVPMTSLPFKRIAEQKHIERSEDYVQKRFVPHTEYDYSEDYSQSSARCFEKISEPDGRGRVFSK